jgi:hypothetical protein
MYILLNVGWTIGVVVFDSRRDQNGSGAHPVSYPVGTRALSLAVERPKREADHSLPSSAEVKERVELYLHSPNTPSWRGAHLKHGDAFLHV